MVGLNILERVKYPYCCRQSDDGAWVIQPSLVTIVTELSWLLSLRTVMVT